MKDSYKITTFCFECFTFSNINMVKEIWINKSLFPLLFFSFMLEQVVWLKKSVLVLALLNK